ncbi:GDSL esterase/lipase At5g14450-like [Herrania umbratica]|uniref:GDSL esterase/lipase At5g14450-like n=1 Tax=Herrania umbratica TaxID=108875 RepID=A0A6J1BIR2_9ROSI|nr:GDSL esterase/lipase At5g14450-like [Herrania umbratica]
MFQFVSSIVAAMEFARVILSGILVSLLQSVGAAAQVKDLPPCNFKAIYNFGDSNSDTGAISAAIFPRQWPNGETFFHKPAGRVCDGRLMIDFIAERLGLPFLSAYLDAIGSDFRQGANFASGGSTIVPQNKTIAESGLSPFALNVQVFQYDQFKARTTDLYKDKRYSCRSHLPRPEDFPEALYVFDIGQNDIAYGLRTVGDAQILASIPNIISQLAIAVEHLYTQGTRTFWIHNTGPIGCLPSTLLGIKNPPPGFLDKHGCVKSQNDIAKEFNRELKNRVIKLRADLPQAAITYVDIYAAKYGLISNSKQQGFVDAQKICCGYHKNGIDVGCGGVLPLPNGTQIFGAACKDPSLYISWDGVHYTEAANRWIASRLINGSLSDPPVPITHACYRTS